MPVPSDRVSILNATPWIPGHKNHCAYRNNHDFPCLCQPPSLFHEPTKLWYCDCCDKPRARLRYGLCEMCESHQYSDGRQADFEHDVTSED